MTPESQGETDRPEPEDALTGAADRTPDHDPADDDDRDVPLDDPAEPDAPVDDDSSQPWDEANG
jgi:hypothetical protein